MAGITKLNNSKGLMGLTHYRSSKVSTSMYEPIYHNLFTVQMEPPAGLGLTGQSEEVKVILEGLRQVSGLDTSQSSGEVKMQKYKMATRSFAGAMPKTYIDVTTDWELNLQYENGYPQNYTWKFLRAWNDLIWDPLSGRMGLKVDYVAPSMTITIHDRAGTPFHQWILYNVFPTQNLNEPQLTYESDDLWKITGWQLRCDVWDEIAL